MIGFDLDFAAQAVELQIYGVFHVPLLVAVILKFSHEDELLEQSEVGILFAAVAGIVHEIGENVVIILLFDFSHDAKGVLGEGKRFTQKATLGPRRLLFRQLLENVN